MVENSNLLKTSPSMFSYLKFNLLIQFWNHFNTVLNIKDWKIHVHIIYWRKRYKLSYWKQKKQTPVTMTIYKIMLSKYKQYVRTWVPAKGAKKGSTCTHENHFSALNAEGEKWESHHSRYQFVSPKEWQVNCKRIPKNNIYIFPDHYPNNFTYIFQGETRTW